jgi:ATP-dependent 26S proteasome regulatory subunit
MSNHRTVDNINAGIQIAAEAVQADREERYWEAKRLYGKAVHLLLPFTRNNDIPVQQRRDMGERIDQYRIRLRNLDRVVSEAAISPSRRSPSNFKVKYNPPKLSTPSTLRFNNFTVSKTNNLSKNSPRNGRDNYMVNNTNSTLSNEALNLDRMSLYNKRRKQQQLNDHSFDNKNNYTNNNMNVRSDNNSSSSSDNITAGNNMNYQKNVMSPSRLKLSGSSQRNFVPRSSSNSDNANNVYSVPLAHVVSDSKPGWNKRTKVPKDILSSPVTQYNKTNNNNYNNNSNNHGTNSNGGGKKKSEQMKADQYNSQLEQNIMQELMEKNLNVKWNDIAGLEKAKQTLQEAVILPALRPDLFQGLRAPPRGVLLFGPPGTGKTMLAKCVATESHANFFNISASSLTSKWHGEGEKLVRKLFDIARKMQPSVIFIDEIDSLLSSRRENEHDAVRRLKTEFLVHLDGAGTDEGDRVLIMGATNRPDDLDDAMIRRLTKRIYIGLPTANARITLVKNLLKKQPYDINDAELQSLVQLTDGFSGSDLANLCREAAFGPIRELGSRVMTALASDVRSLQYVDFQNALQNIRPSVSKESIMEFESWSKKYSST